jgi:hypothetical protein
MTRIRLLSLALGLVLVPAVAGAQTSGSAEGGDTYGGAKVGEDVSPTESDTLMPEEKAAPVEAEEPAPAEINNETTIDVNTPPATAPEDDVDVTVEVHEAEPPPAPAVVIAPVEEEEPAKKGITPFGMAISAGGGVTDFLDNDAEDMTEIGGAWDVRLALGTRSWIGLEAGYIGSMHDIAALGLDPDAALMSNGLEGLVRVNLGTFAIQPYAVGGVGWSRYELVNDDFNTSSVNDEDDVLTVPVGAGLSTYLGRGEAGAFMLDARFTYRAAFREDLLDPGTGNEEQEDLDNWAATLRLGYEF